MESEKIENDSFQITNNNNIVLSEMKMKIICKVELCTLSSSQSLQIIQYLYLHTERYAFYNAYYYNLISWKNLLAFDHKVINIISNYLHMLILL